MSASISSLSSISGRVAAARPSLRPAARRASVTLASAQAPRPSSSRRVVLGVGLAAALSAARPAAVFADEAVVTKLPPPLLRKNVFIDKTENYVQVLKEVLIANDKGKQINSSMFVQLYRNLDKQAESTKDPEVQAELKPTVEAFKQVALIDVWAYNKEAKDGLPVDNPELKAKIFEELEGVLGALPSRS